MCDVHAGHWYSALPKYSLRVFDIILFNVHTRQPRRNAYIPAYIFGPVLSIFITRRMLGKHSREILPRCV
ncbi:hypothetical protein BDZ89DRAFT_1057804, partial [Hymenopellis radicata]